MTDIAAPPAGYPPQITYLPVDLGEELAALRADVAALHEEVHETLRLTREHHTMLDRFRPLIERWAARLPVAGGVNLGRKRGDGRPHVF